MTSKSSSSPVFGRDAYLAALEPPRFDIGGGRVLVGRILSADEWFAFEDRLALAAADQLTRAGLRALMQEMTDAMFAPVGRVWFRRPASKYLFDLPFSAQLETFRSFMIAQAEVQKGTTLRAMAAEAMSGTPSPS